MTAQRLADQYRRWFEYEKDSDAKVLASLKAVAEELQSSEGFQRAVDLMAHIVAARSMWLYLLPWADCFAAAINRR